MKSSTKVYKRELAYYFTTPVAYIVIGLYLIGISLFLWVIPGQYNIVESGYSQVDGLFELSPWLMILLCPALTMRLFAEDKQSGMWELLRTKPYPLWRIVTDKYLAAWTLMLIGLLPNTIHYFIVSYIAEPIGNIDTAQFCGSFIGLILLSSAFLGIGLVMSSFTLNQIVAYILGALSSFVLYWVSMQDFYTSLSRGVIDLRDMLYFLSIAVIGVIVTIFVLDRKP